MEGFIKASLDWTYGYRDPSTSELTYYGPGKSVLVPEVWARTMGFPIVDEVAEPRGADLEQKEPEDYSMAEVQLALAQDWFIRAGVRSDVALSLAEAGFKDLGSIRGASEEQFLAVQGVGKATVEKIHAYLQEA